MIVFSLDRYSPLDTVEDQNPTKPRTARNADAAKPAGTPRLNAPLPLPLLKTVGEPLSAELVEEVPPVVPLDEVAGTVDPNPLVFGVTIRLGHWAYEQCMTVHMR